MRKKVLDMVYELAKENKNIFYIGSDLNRDVLSNFKEEIPERFFMEGINEANIISMAAGLSSEGKIPYVNTLAVFITRRCYEQIVLDLGLHKSNVRLIGNGGGLVYAPLGPTHLAIDDIAILRAVPNMTILVPADAHEIERLMPLTVDYQGPIYIRLAKGGDHIVTKDEYKYEIGKAIPIRQGKDALILTTGVTLKIAIDATEELNKDGIDSSIVHVHTLKPLDKKTIVNYASDVSAIVTIEEHSVIGGLGSAVAETILEANFNEPKRFKRIGLPDVFADGYGSQEKLMEKYLITTKNLYLTVKELME